MPDQRIDHDRVAGQAHESVDVAQRHTERHDPERGEVERQQSGQFRRLGRTASGQDAHQLSADLADRISELGQHIERQRIGAQLELERAVEESWPGDTGQREVDRNDPFSDCDRRPGAPERLGLRIEHLIGVSEPRAQIRNHRTAIRRAGDA